MCPAVRSRGLRPDLSRPMTGPRFRWLRAAATMLCLVGFYSPAKGDCRPLVANANFGDESCLMDPPVEVRPVSSATNNVRRWHCPQLRQGDLFELVSYIIEVGGNGKFIRTLTNFVNLAPTDISHGIFPEVFASIGQNRSPDRQTFGWRFANIPEGHFEVECVVSDALGGDDWCANPRSLIDLHQLLGRLLKPVGCEPEQDSRDGEHYREGGYNALVVGFDKMIGAPRQDQRSLQERGAGMLLILFAGGAVLLGAYQAWSKGR
jgi:hypothetical protein